MDGTILDTLADLTDSVNAALARFGYPTHSVEAIRTFVGNGLVKLVERACPRAADEEERAAVLAAFNEHYAVHCTDKTGPYPGIVDLLRDLRAHGMLTAVVSNKVDYGVQALCKRYFDGLFDAAVGDRPEFAVKPAPDMVPAVLTGLGVEKQDADDIGDSEVDVATAKNSGLDLIAVTWGFREEELLRSLGAEKLAHNTYELRDMLLF
jgi:phosphoglycolate phosphatase